MDLGLFDAQSFEAVPERMVAAGGVKVQCAGLPTGS